MPIITVIYVCYDVHDIIRFAAYFISQILIVKVMVSALIVLNFHQFWGYFFRKSPWHVAIFEFT